MLVRSEIAALPVRAGVRFFLELRRGILVRLRKQPKWVNSRWRKALTKGGEGIE
jgi:hypothetical protein